MTGITGNLKGYMFSKQVLYRSIYGHVVEAGKTEMKGKQLVQVKSHIGHVYLMSHFAMLGGPIISLHCF